MIRPTQLGVLLTWVLVPLQIVAPSLSAEDRGVEVVFKMDTKVVKGPAEITIKSRDQRASIKVRHDVVELPDWAVSTDGSIAVSLTARFKSRTLHFEHVKLWQGMGRLTFVVDNPPFDDGVDYALGEERIKLTEAHALFLEPVNGDGYVMAHPADSTRGDRWK